jgi:hypothetical protein
MKVSHGWLACMQVKEAAMKLGYQADETFCLKISQLRELFVVRWSVFLLGPAGCGKTAIWRTLMKAQNNAGEKTVSPGFRLAGNSRGCRVPGNDAQSRVVLAWCK